MSTVSRHTETITTEVYTVPTPSAYSDVAKAMNWAADDWKVANPGKEMYDDSLTVVSLDESIEVRWTRATEKKP